MGQSELGGMLDSPAEMAFARSVDTISTQGGCSPAPTRLFFQNYESAVATPSALAQSNSTAGSGVEQSWLNSSLGSSLLIWSASPPRE